MATYIKSNTGNVTESKDFKYNTVYEFDRENKKYEPSDIDPTGMGDGAYIYGNYLLTKYKGENLKENETGNIFGGKEDCRSNTPMGDITVEGNYSYNNGANNNVPNYLTDNRSEEDKNRSDMAFTINGNNILSLRNDTDEDNTDGVFDDGKGYGDKDEEKK